MKVIVTESNITYYRLLITPHIIIVGKVLDLIFINCENVINPLAMHSSIVYPVTSDHCLISLAYYQTFSNCMTPTYCVCLSQR